MNRNLLTAIGLVALVIPLGCDSNKPYRPNVDIPSKQPLDLSVTPMPNDEAEIAAMVLSRELVAPSWLYNRIKRDLEAIRGKYQDSIPEVKIKFPIPFRPSSLEMQVDLYTLFDTVTGGGKILDSLNNLYRIDTFYRMFDDFYRFQFEGRLNSVRLVDIYSGIPGEYMVWSTGPAPGDSPMLLIWPAGKTFRYFFRDAWGDCPSGCMSSKVFSFTTKKDSITFQGSYPSDTSNQSPPSWLDTFRMAHDTTFYYKVWYADSFEAVN